MSEISDEMVRAFRVAERTAQGFRKKPNERVRAGLEAALTPFDEEVLSAEFRRGFEAGEVNAALLREEEREAAYRAGYGQGRDDEAAGKEMQ